VYFLDPQIGYFEETKRRPRPSDKHGNAGHEICNC
jgi:hypothetical protein